MRPEINCEFAEAYLECALWSTTDNSTVQGGEPFDANYTVDDIADETLVSMLADCKAFLDTATESDGRGNVCVRDLISGRESDAGHDFWLTRNGHGAGFWDGDWDDVIEDDTEGKTVGDLLTALSEPYGTFDLYLGDDGQIHGS